MFERLHRRHRALLRDESGMSLVELLVAMVLLGMMLVMVFSLYTSAWRTVGLSREITVNTKMVSNAMNETTRSIRAATENPVTGQVLNDPAFVTAKPTDILFYAFVDVYSDLGGIQQPLMIRLRVDPTTGKLEESRWKGTATSDGKWVFTSNPCVTVNTPVGCTAPSIKRTLATTMSPSGGTTGLASPFQYLNSDKLVIPNTAAGLSVADQRLVDFVKVTFAAQTSLTDDSNKVILENIVGIPNLGFAK